MKRVCSLVFLVGMALGFGVPTIAAQDRSVAFSVTLSDLHRAAMSGDDSAIPTDRLLVIHGDLGSVAVHADTETEFIAEVELVGGAWLEDSAVELHRAYAVFQDTRFRDAFSRRSPSRLQSGQTVLVLARYLGLGVDYDETTTVAVMEVLDFRPVN